ncbi:MAG: DUF3078 domain-containing protein [Cyclobacteriaceae bacterium]|nr:DUF3078 domain-containing protein [Cyclobacteriaceae bacterium]MCX7637846.1 DUF3078 domain-containing protein [Cyclobacteriaceae bacterium]MDW8331551.1 DUF3078 domain-containing protein [Cyclobacteriaceae bacterium]
MKKILSLLLVALSFSQTIAQIVKPDTASNWRKKFILGLNFNQASFSSNWKGGGINSVGLNGLLNYKANYRKGKLSWDNEADFLYGFVRNEGQGFRKTVDRLFLDTKVGYSISEKWDLFTSLNLLSQFAPGYRYNDDNTQNLISDFFAPAFITSAWGAEYHPSKFFRMRISPFAPRITIVQDNNGRFDAVSTTRPYGVEIGKDTRFEWLAFQLLADFNKDIFQNVNLSWRYMMFANYETLSAKNIDHRLDLTLAAKVGKFFNVNFGVIALYDSDQTDGVQLNQLFNIGFLYSFQNFEEKK